MSGLSHTPGKRTRGQTLRGFESRLLRQLHVLNHPQTYEIPQFSSRELRVFCFQKLGGYPRCACTIFMADEISADTSVILLGTMRVVLASAATLE